MKVFIAGDFCPRGRLASKFDNEEYASVLSEVKAKTSQADYAIVNFECAINTGGAKPIDKMGPLRYSSENGMTAIQWAGFNCVTLANNHFYDFGEIGVENTLNACSRLGIDTVGGGRNLTEASKVLYRQIGDRMLAVINCCENEFSIATETSSGSNPLNPIKQYYNILEARKKADVVLIIVHGGHELFQLPSPRMVETYRFFIDAGADAVVNHHQHCFSGYEVYKGKPIFYGLGNFCFDNPKRREGIWTEGYAVAIDFSTSQPWFELHPYIQCAGETCVHFLPQDAYNQRIRQLNDIVADPEKHREEINQYYARFAEAYSDSFEPFGNRFYLRAKRRGWFPSLLGKKKFLFYKNHILCESHRDKLSYWLENSQK